MSINSIELKRILFIPIKLLIREINFAKFVFPLSISLPYVPKLIPARTTSLTPLLLKLDTSSITSSTDLLRAGPLTYGTLQYVQNLLQPSCIFSQARVR